MSSERDEETDAHAHGDPTGNSQPPAKESNLGKRVAGGAAWLVSLRMVLRLFGVVNIVVLARLLVPEDFGLLALATIAQGILVAMAEFRPDLALIREQSADRRHYDTAWTLSVIRGALIGLVLVVAAPHFAGYFDEPRLEIIIYLLGTAAFIEGFQNVGTVDFFKELEFDRQFRFILVTRTTTIAVSWAVAFIWRNYWALVVAAVLQHTLPTLLSYFMHSYRPRFTLVMWRRFLGFSTWVMLTNFVNFVNQRSALFILGKLTGAPTVGAYTLARRIVYLPSTELVSPIGQAVFPGFAKLAGDPQRLREGYLRVLGLVVMVGVPAAVGLGLVVDPFVKVVLGTRWIEVIPIMQVLVISGVLRIATVNTTPVFLARGKPQMPFTIHLSTVVLLVPLLIWGVGTSGPIGAAWAVVAADSLGLLVSISLVLRELRVGLTQLLATVWRPLTAAVFMGVCAKATEAAWPAKDTLGWDFGLLVVLLTVGATAYVVTLVTSWRLSGAPQGAEREALSMLPSPLGARVRRWALGEARTS